ncbi:MAG TPA: hypothetical protein VGI56_11810 [Galbitalea sp.]
MPRRQFGELSPISPIDLPTGPLSLPPLLQTSSQRHVMVVVHQNRAAWTSLVFGLIAIGIAVSDALPVSTDEYASAIGLFAVYWGIRGIIRRNAGFASNLWAPIVGIVLGAVATVLMFGMFVAQR